MTALEQGRALVRGLSLTPNEAARHGLSVNRDGVRRTAFDLLAQPEVDMARLARIWPELASIDRFAAEQIEIDAKYAVYLDRQAGDIARFQKDAGVVIPGDLDLGRVAGLSNELREKLEASRPATLAQAAAIDGMTPAALALMLAAVKRRGRRRAA